MVAMDNVVPLEVRKLAEMSVSKNNICAERLT